MEKWQEQDYFPTRWGREGRRGRVARSLSSPRSLSDWDLQMFYYAKAS